MPEPLKTALFPCHLQLGAKIVPFAGYSMPVQYSGILEETKTVRSKCGLFDVSHMGQFSVRGKNVWSELQKLVTNDLSRLFLGKAQYNILCLENGGAIDDLVIYFRGDNHAFICVNASNIKKDFDWFKTHLPKTLSLENESDSTSLLALQGPLASPLLKKFLKPTEVDGLKYYTAKEETLFDIPCYLSRTGYTGEDGFEIYVSNPFAVTLWERLLEEGRGFGLIPCGLGSRDILRLEMGYALYGHELNENFSPLSAGLSWVIKLKKETPFIGQEALKTEAKNGPSKILKAFLIQDKRTARERYPIFSEDTLVGHVTSGSFSPHINAPIALGFVDREHSQKSDFFIEIRESKVPVKAVKLPFLPSKVVS